MRAEILGYLLALPILVVIALIGKPLMGFWTDLAMFTTGPLLVTFIIQRVVTWFVCGKWILR